jgi:hypothetical protein
MAFISVTRLRLRSARFLPAFALRNLRVLAQARAAPGFRGGALLADRAFAFWTLTAWDDEGSMRAYASTGTHRAAMPRFADWCDEGSVAGWEQGGAALPSWAEADRRMREGGRPSKLRRPSPHHADLSFPPARTSLTGPLRPAAARSRRRP